MVSVCLLRSLKIKDVTEMGKWLILTLFGLISFLPSDASSRLIGITYTFEPYADAVVSINEFTAATVDIGSTGFYFLNSLAQNSSGVFYTVSDDASDPQLIRIDPTTWSGRTETRISFYSGSARPRIRGLAFDPGDDLFAIHHTRPAFAPREEEWDTELYLINKGSGSMAPIGATGFTGIQSITFSPDGETLYGWDVHEGLVTIDTTTGRATNVNPRVRGTAEIQGIAFAPDGTLYHGWWRFLMILDPDTGAFITSIPFDGGFGFKATLAVRSDGILFQTGQIYDVLAFILSKIDPLTGAETHVGAGPAWVRDLDFSPVVVESVEIDIKPGSERNAVNPTARGILPVAILGSDTFDVADVDVTTLVFGPGEAAPRHSRGGHAEDVNDDGYTDWVSHYRIEEVAVAAGDTELCLTGETLDGIPFEGCDDIVTVPYVGERWRVRANRQR